MPGRDACVERGRARESEGETGERWRDGGETERQRGRVCAAQAPAALHAGLHWVLHVALVLHTRGSVSVSSAHLGD